MQEKYNIGNAQTIGSYEIQSNYFSTVNSDTALAVLADGNMDHINGRRAAVLAVETSIREFGRRPHHLEFAEFYDFLICKIIKNINENIYLDKKPNVSLSIIYIENDDLFYYTVGGNEIFLTDGRDYRPLTDRKGHCKMKRTESAGMISRGICEALNEMELLEFLKKQINPFEKAQRIIEGVNKKNIRMAKNSTILLIEGGL